MSVLKRVLSLIPHDQKKKVTGLLILMFLGMILETLGIGLILPAISAVLDTQRVRDLLPLSGFSDFEVITSFMTLLIVIFSFKTIYLLFLTWTQSKFSFTTAALISEKLLSIYLRQPYLFHTSRNSAELIRNITLEVNMFSQVITALLIIITELLILVGIVGIVVYIEPLLASIAIGSLLIFGFILERLLKIRIENLGEGRQNDEFERLKAIQQGLGGIKTTKILGKEDEFLRRYGEPNNSFAKVSIKIATIQSFPRLWFELLIVIILSLIIISSALNGINPTNVIPTLALFGAAAFRLLPSANRLLSSLQSLRFNSVVIGTLENELKLRDYIETDNSHSIGSKLDSFQDLSINSLSFNYPGQENAIIDNQSLSIKRGQRVGLIGESGSGKTTLINIVLGLLPPTSGQVTIDGVNLAEIRKSWQRNLGYVPQEVFLDDDTLKKNIAFGIPEQDISMDQVEKCIQQAQLKEFVDYLDNGIETIIGERGSKISGGQKQRIGLARALYHSPKVLVLDEATSSLDTNTESEVMNSVYSLDNDLTIIIVAHRLSTLNEVDRLIKLEKGKLIKEK